MNQTQPRTRRLLSFVLTLALVLSLCAPLTAGAAPAADAKTALAAAPLSAEDGSGYIRNAYIEAFVTDNGHYTIGTVAGDPNSSTDDNARLLFGHPGSETGQTLIRVDGTDYYFHDYVTGVSFSGNQCTATASIDGLTVQQILTLTTNPYTGLADVVKIRYSYRNDSGRARQVGVRIMLDTMLGQNDGAPFRVNGADVTSELELSGSRVPQYWQSFDSLEQPNVTATGFFWFSNEERPDKVQFAYWPEIYGSEWNYQVSGSQSLVGDSAVAAYFNPRTVAPGGSYSVVTYYGVSGFSSGNSDLEGELAARVTAPTVLYGAELIGGYLNNPFDVSLYLTNSGGATLHNVRAVLDLDDAPQLLRSESQSPSVRVGDLAPGDNAAVQWTLRAVPQGRSSTAQYRIALYADGKRLKVLNLSLQLNELRKEDLYRTVRFDLNGGEGLVPVPQQVLIGTLARRPQEKPTREGFDFTGWYANPACTGASWFNSLTGFFGYPVTQNITLYAGWVKSQNLSYVWDTYDFINSTSNFTKSRANGYTLTGDYYDILMANRSKFEKANLLDAMKETWGGSCFGMSAVLALVRAKQLDVDFFQTDASCLHDLDRPIDNATIWNLINYYHLTQVSNRTATERNDYDTENEQPNIRALVNAVQDSHYPVVLGFNINKRKLFSTETERVGGHAVIAYGLTKTADGYDIAIWDPNDKEQPNTLHVSSDFSTAEFEREYDSGRRSSYIKYALTVEAGDYDYRNLEEALQGRGYRSGEGANGYAAVLTADAGDTLRLTTNYDSFTIASSDGTKATVTQGKVTGGTLDISDGTPENEIDAALRLSFQLPAGADYTITPAVMEDEETGEALSEYRSTLYAEDDFFTSLTAADTGAVTFGRDGAVSTAFDETVAQTVTLTGQDGAPWYLVTAEAETDGLSVTPGRDGMYFASTADTALSVTAQDDYNTLTFAPVALAAGEETTLEEDVRGTARLDGQTLELGHALIFRTCGGAPIAAQTDIPWGETAEEPAAPEREGFVFAGWYTTPDWDDGEDWDFETPITGDTRIYARWLVDESYFHAVTFRAEGEDDIIVIVRDGAAVEEIPAVPARAGYDGAWDIEDLSCVTSDLLVNAIYTAHSAQTWIVTFDANGGRTDEPSLETGADGRLPYLPAATRAGYDFAGWYTREGEAVTTETDFHADTTVYARWSRTETPDEPVDETAQPVYPITVAGSNHGRVEASRQQAEAGETIALTVKPEPGFVLETLTVSGRGGAAAITAVDGGYCFTMPAWAVTVTASFMEDNAMLNFFVDVPAGAYYYDAVRWAAENGIAQGDSPVTFNPDADCTRAQAVTMIWRALGSPAPRSQELPFTDVPADAYYADAVRWMMEQGIATGVAADCFAPDMSCTRAQLMTLLWRAMGEPETAIASGVFADVPAEAYYAPAAHWAVENGVTTGVAPGYFAPDMVCSRGQLVTMLWRCLNK